MANTTLEKWEEKTLGEIAYIKGGKRLPKGEKLSTEKTNHPYIRVTDFNDKGTVDIDNVQFITNDIYEQIKNYTISSCDLYISIAGTIGKAGIIPQELDGANLTENACKLVYKSKDILNKYIYYYTQTNMFAEQIFDKTKMAAMPKLALTRLATVKLLVPPLPEQQRIVAKLDKAFEAIDKVKANAEQNLNNAKELYKVVLNRVFNSNKYQFEHIKLDDLCEIITDGTHQTPTYADKGVIFLSAKNVTSEVIDWENIKYIPDSLHNELKKRVSPQKGDILLAKNGTTGVAAIVDRDCVFDIYVSLCMLRPKKTVNVQYLLLAINNPITKDKFNKSLIGIGVPNLHLNKIRETTVPIPSPKFQDEISSLLNGLKAEYLKLEQIYTQKIKECDELKQSILQKAFRGEL